MSDLGPQEGDESITCRDCSSTFVHSVADQEFFRSKGWENKPIRCEPCRKARKAQDTRGGGGYNQGGGYGQGSFGGGAFGSRGGGGGGGRSCYNCGKEGHMSRECTEPRKSGPPGGGGGGGGNCYKCNEPGHKSFECTSGGGAPSSGRFGGGGGGAGGGCFKCGEPGHKSFECTQGGGAPRQQGGRW